MAYKIALSAGHGRYTPGKRCLKSLDPIETREWVLNDRIADKVENLLSGYTGYELLRVDDTTGNNDVPLATRVSAANNWGASVYVSMHHNAGVGGGKGGGIMAFVWTKASQASKDLQARLYNELVAATGLKGNRSTPITSANLYECRVTTMPAVLLELGFMDSATDVPVILSENYANKCAEAITKVLVEQGKLVKKPAPATPSTVYRVQVGAFSNKANAENLVKKLKAVGFDAIITT